MCVGAGKLFELFRFGSMPHAGMHACQGCEAVVQPLVRVLPLTAAIDAMRGNMLQGMNLGQLIVPVGILLAWFVVPVAVSLRIFRWR